MPAKKKIDFEKAREMYRGGAPMSRIAKHFGVSDEAVRRCFIRNRFEYKKRKVTKKRGKRVNQQIQAEIPLPDIGPDYKALHNKALAENEKLKTELKRIRQAKERTELKLSQFKSENTTLRQSRIDTPEIIREAVKPLIEEIRHEIDVLRDEFKGIDITAIQRNKPTYIDGWSVIQSGADNFFRAFKTLGGKQRTVYIGKNANPAIVRTKTKAAIKKNREKWGLTDSDTHVSKEDLIKSLIFEHSRQGQFALIHKIRDGYEKAGHDDFDTVIAELASRYAVELHGGDPSRLTRDQIRRLYYDKAGTMYVTVSWYGEGKRGSGKK